MPSYEQPIIFLLLFTLAILAQITSTSLIGGSVTVEVSSAVSLATVSLYGPFAAGVVAAGALTTLSIISLHASWSGWPRAIERIGFNVGMGATAMFMAGILFQFTTQWLGSDTMWAQLFPWILAAVINDQVNLWLLIGILHLQSGVKPLEIWHQHKWAVPINVLVMSVGGGLLTIAVRQFNFLGIAVFFLPIVMSAYSFRLYVTRTKRQMEELEELVALRTSDLAQVNKELEELNKDKDAFLAVLTHDMRTPLTSIKGYASILRDQELPREQQVHIMKIILRSQETLLEIVNNILEIEQLQSGTPALMEPSTFDLALLLRSVVESVEAMAMEKKICLQYEQVPSPVMIDADMRKIARVLMNLVSNAIKYTPEEGVVAVKTYTNGRYAIVEVKDNGYGIPADELPHIFERYSRVKGHRHIAVGTGLGLAIVKNLVEAHKGEIRVTSEEDKGSTFTVKLPL